MVITENELLVHLNFVSTIHNLPFPYHLVNIQLKHSTTAPWGHKKVAEGQTRVNVLTHHQNN